MKYLGLHKLLWAIIVSLCLILEIAYYGFWYILELIWTFKLPKHFWYRSHHVKSRFDGSIPKDYNPWYSFVRRYNLIS